MCCHWITPSSGRHGILFQQKNKTSAICEAVCGYHRQKGLEDTLRKLLREELKNVAIPQTAEVVEEPDTTVDTAVLDFLLAIQKEE